MTGCFIGCLKTGGDSDPSQLTLSEIRRRSEDMAMAHYTNYSWFCRSLSCDEGEIFPTDTAGIPQSQRLDPVRHHRDRLDDEVIHALNTLEGAIRQSVLV